MQRQEARSSQGREWLLRRRAEGRMLWQVVPAIM